MTHVDWHPYPKSKPKNDGEYLTTVLFKTGDKYVISNYWICNGGNGKWVEGFEHSIIAWAEQPEPYSKEMKNKKRRASERKDKTISNNLAKTNNPR